VIIGAIVSVISDWAYEFAGSAADTPTILDTSAR
jgi:hypothetical protein